MYDHKSIENKWIKKWDDDKTYKFVDDISKKKYYVLDMFPYPSGKGLHVGHPKGYVASDILARYKKLNGFNVLHPIGWDAFGLPAEQYALETGNHPREFTQKNINNFRKQLKRIGFSFDYEKEVDTTDENYYKWTQWIFLQLYKNGLAEIKNVDVNWCEKLGTVLANEEVLKDKNGNLISERGSFSVVKKPMKQWVLKITKYAEKLIDGLDEINWSEGLKNIQKLWIGKSEGIELEFKLKNSELKIPIYTLMPELIFGVTYIVIGPESSMIKKLKITDQSILDYIEKAKLKEEYQRINVNQEITAIFTNLFAINPINNLEIPIIISDYVIGTYASGCVMGVGANDIQGNKITNKYNLNKIQVIDKNNKMINSDFLNGLSIEEAREKITNYLLDKKIGTKKTYFNLRDWLFSRQRYWGEPFPVLYDENNNIKLIEDLPVILPKTNNIKPSNDGSSPLSNLKEWLYVEIDGKKYIRDTNTMPQWAGSSWYYLAYILKNDDNTYCPLNSLEAKKRFERWLPVDVYIGGQEHAVLHLLYARFWHHFLYDIGIVSTKEPFNLVVNQGMILDENNQKMSKSKGNVINVNEVIDEYGADALRIYEMFMGPINSSLAWSNDSLNGSRKWLDKVYSLFENKKQIFKENVNDDELLKEYDLFVYKITDHIEKMNFNLGVSEMMIFINACFKAKEIKKSYLKNFLIILSCYAPFLAEEINENFFNSTISITNEKWPIVKSKLEIEEKEFINLPIQINGKVKDIIKVNFDIDEKNILLILEKNEKIQKIILNKKINRVIYVKNKIFNMIIS